MRILAVVDGELAGADERGEWALLEALVAAKGPEPPEVRAMALVHVRGDAGDHGTGYLPYQVRYLGRCLPVSPDAVALSLMAASQRGTGVWVRRVVPAVSGSRQLPGRNAVAGFRHRPRGWQCLRG